MNIEILLICTAITLTQADFFIQSPRCEPVTCLPQTILPQSCLTGNIYTEGYCSNAYFQQSPINVDTTRPIKQVFPNPLTTYNFSSIPSITTWQNKQGTSETVRRPCSVYIIQTFLISSLLLSSFS